MEVQWLYTTLLIGYVFFFYYSNKSNWTYVFTIVSLCILNDRALAQTVGTFFDSQILHLKRIPTPEPTIPCYGKYFFHEESCFWKTLSPRCLTSSFLDTDTTFATRSDNILVLFTASLAVGCLRVTNPRILSVFAIVFDFWTRPRLAVNIFTSCQTKPEVIIYIYIDTSK